MPKNIRIVLFVFLIAAISVAYCTQLTAAADQPPVNIYLFWTKGCPHCAQEKEFLAKLASSDQNLKIITLELTESRDNRELFGKVGQELRANVSGVPFTVVGERYFIGWLAEDSTGAAITNAVQEARRTRAPDVVAGLRGRPADLMPPEKQAIPEKLPLPLVGEIEIKYLSLGLVTLIIGLLDGFNPCAMWVLVFLINLLLGLEDRRRMWILGGTFIAASGLIYFLFMTAWLNFLVFVGFIIGSGSPSAGSPCWPGFITCGNISPIEPGSASWSPGRAAAAGWRRLKRRSMARSSGWRWAASSCWPSPSIWWS